MRFSVGAYGETFGTAPAGATETILNFTKRKPLINI